MDVAPLSPEVGRLTVVYDPDGAFCAWCRAWLETQTVLVPVRFTPAGGPEAQARLGGPSASRSAGPLGPQPQVGLR